MGYRCNLMTEEIYADIPKWFRDKYEYHDHYTFNENGPICSNSESKGHYELLEDLQKLVKDEPICGVLLWEDTRITCFKVYSDRYEVDTPESSPSGHYVAVSLDRLY